VFFSILEKDKQAKLDEHAQYSTWKPLIPIFGQPTALTDTKVWQIQPRFNPKQVAEQTTRLLRDQSRREQEQYNKNFSKAIKSMVYKIIGCQDDNANIVQPQEQQQPQQQQQQSQKEEELTTPEKQLDKTVVVVVEEGHEQQQHHRESIQIKTVCPPLVSNCEKLEQIFTHHENSAVNGNHSSNRSNGINLGQFVSSQFARYEDSSDEGDSKANDGGGRETKMKQDSTKLIQTSQILDEWLSESVDNEIRSGSRKDAVGDADEGRLLSRSKMKVQKKTSG
jgi:hypothetical protein